MVSGGGEGENPHALCYIVHACRMHLAIAVGRTRIKRPVFLGTSMGCGSNMEKTGSTRNKEL